MKRHSLIRRNATAFIRLDVHQCQACWECIAVCPQQVIGKTPFKGHARIVAAAQCTGCKKCVRACPHAAIEYTYRPTRASDRQQNP